MMFDDVWVLGHSPKECYSLRMMSAVSDVATDSVASLDQTSVRPPVLLRLATQRATRAAIFQCRGWKKILKLSEVTVWPMVRLQVV